jgi:hypothetical protein
MTVLAPAPTVPTSTLEAPSAKPARPRRRWHRAAIPFGLLIVFWAWTLVAHQQQEPNLRDPGTMSPTGTGPDGSSVLADRLRAQGVNIQRVASTAQAVSAAATGSATVLVPAPDFLDGTLMTKLSGLTNLRVVMVRPGIIAQAASSSPFAGLFSRWASKAFDPGCSAPVAIAAGRATAYQSTYARADELSAFATVTMDCYQGGLVAARVRGVEIVYVGASDPFRNSRIGEQGNATLATGLLSVGDRLIWLDLHAKETTSTNVDITLPRYHRDDQARTGGGDSLFAALPPMLWAWLSLLAVGAVLVAFVRGRRLGPPVAEPLPVVVPAAEAVTGRGRLYRRVRARQPTLNALRASAIARLARAVYPFDEAPPERDLLPGDGRSASSRAEGAAAEALVARIAERVSEPNAIRAVLYGDTVSDDDELEAAVARLDALVAAVVRHNPSAAPTPYPSTSAVPTHLEETP